MTKKQAQIIMAYNEEIAEVEDEFLYIWLENGCPDGTTEEELIEDYDINYFFEWAGLAKNLLESRAIQEGEI